MNRHQAIALLTASGQPMELIQSELYGVPCRRYKNAPQTLRQLFEDNLSELPFIVFAEERYSFQQTWHKASALACALVEDFSIGKGDRVAICMRNYPEWIMTFNAITSIGAIAVALNSLCQADELVYGVTNSGSTLLIADQERANLLSSDIAQPWT
ncbi:MAG: AMP-binding protein, partial [Porticoccaceae bacterium]